jgi:hypothetical protein
LVGDFQAVELPTTQTVIKTITEPAAAAEQVAKVVTE